MDKSYVRMWQACGRSYSQKCLSLSLVCQHALNILSQSNSRNPKKKITFWTKSSLRYWQGFSIQGLGGCLQITDLTTTTADDNLAGATLCLVCFVSQLALSCQSFAMSSLLSSSNQFQSIILQLPNFTPSKVINWLFLTYGGRKKGTQKL